MQAARPQAIPQEVWRYLIQAGVLLTCPHGQFVWDVGEVAGEASFLVLAGLVRLFHVDSRGAALTVLATGPGGLLGAHPEVPGRPFAVGAEALTDVALLRLEAAEVGRWREGAPEVDAWLRRDLGALLQDTYVRLQLEHAPAKARVAHTLLALERQGLLAGATRQRIAELCNLTVETVVRILSAWLREGVIAHSRFTTLSRAEKARLCAVLGEAPELTPPYL